MNGKKTSWLGYLTPVFATMLLGLASCAPQNATEPEDEEALSLSESELMFANNGGSKDITVGGAETWNFISSEGEDGWLQISKSGNSLSVTVAPNPDGNERSASILVVGKDSQAKVSVKQSAADFILDFSEGEVMFPTAGGQKVIVVSSNSNEWTFDPIPEEANWLTLSGKGEVVTLTATANDTYEAREAALTVTSAAGEKRQLTVKQAAQMKYFIPYVPAKGKPYRAVDAVKYEEARGNVLTAYSEPQEFYGTILPGTLSFLTASPVVPYLDYVTAEVGLPIYSEADVYVMYADESKAELKEFVAFVKENGFTATNDDETEFANAEGTMTLTFDVASFTDGFIAKFTPVIAKPEQPGEFPTWETMPMGLKGVFEMIQNPEFDVNDLIALEAAAGSKMTTEEKSEADGTSITYQMYETGKTDKMNEAMRDYFWGDPADPELDPAAVGVMSEYHMYFFDIACAYWLNGNKPVMTNEFEKLLKDEGYVFDFENEGLLFYRQDLNDTEDHVLVFGPGMYSDLNPGNWTLLMAHFIWEKAAGTSMKANLNTLISTKNYKNAKYVLATPDQKALMEHWNKVSLRNRK